MDHQNHHHHNLKEVASRKSEGTGASGESVEPEALNKKALDIVQRVRICVFLPCICALSDQNITCFLFFSGA